ncbi:hypothetical protein DFH08DRAFT_932489 [Mycena albidolilacea]|uniref:Uncharacterized protein n=1 Tax=Mycena albidolilacea TaxID=1033008 RepID=A0AAD7AGX6_9AGAR|nr:hypothetical protein DFH08DRAFT_932489 [Mycena albidolilacea]
MPNYSPSPLQGSATAALTWVVYDVFLDLDREARSHFYTLFNSLKAHPQIVSVWSRYHTLLALGFFLMEAMACSWNEAFPTASALPLPAGRGSGTQLLCANLKCVFWARQSIGLLTDRDGQLNSVSVGSCSSSSGLMLFMAGAAKIGLVTTIISLLGGTKGLMGSTNILICGPGRVNVPDVNIASRVTSMAVACIYLGLVIHKTLDVVQDIEAMAGRPNPHSACFLKLFRTTLPTLHMCLRDTALYFILVFVALLVNLVLVVSHERFAQLGTPWLLATYSVASTRIFLNLKDLTAATHYGDVTWSEFQRNTALELQFRAGLATNDTRPSMYEMRPVRAPEDISGPDTAGVR